MSKRLIVVLALALVAGLVFSPAYAEVQNVKVSGDIIASGVMRNHFNLANGPAGDKNNIKQSFLMSQARVRIDADLTDNVMTTVRLINERVWNGNNDTASDANSKIDLDLAYVTLKEFLYSPLSLTIGRQEIRFGNALIIGDAGVASGVVGIPTDLTLRKSFDALRATLNYDPLVIDFIYAKIKEGNSTRNNDVALSGVNASYDINSKVNVSAYYFLKRDNDGDSASSSSSTSRGKADKVNTIGALLTAKPITDLATSLEAAYQFGKNDNGTTAVSHRAWAIQAMADYTFSKVKMTPMVGASYTYLSGNKTTTNKTHNQGWDPMFYDQQLTSIIYALHPFTNMSAFNLNLSAKPVEDVTVKLTYGYYDLASKATGSWTLNNTSRYNGSTQYLPSVTLTGKRHLGDEIDATIIYDYTEDVQFGLTAGWLKTGSGLSLDRRLASQVIGSMKVTF